MSLASLKGPAEVEVEILMSRTNFDGAFLIVEGDDDSRFFRNRVESSTCEIVNAGGKLTVIGGVERLNNLEFRGAVGVVDDDCDTIDGRWKARPNLVSTALGSALRLALDSPTWRSTTLALGIAAWETTNPPFRVLL